MPGPSNPTVLLDVALAEARAGLAEGGIPIGAARTLRDSRFQVLPTLVHERPAPR